MREEYNSKHGDIGYFVYQRVFQSENIGSGKRSQDDWDVYVNTAKFNAKNVLKLMTSMHVSNVKLAKIMKRRLGQHEGITIHSFS